MEEGDVGVCLCLDEVGVVVRGEKGWANHPSPLLTIGMGRVHQRIKEHGNRSSGSDLIRRRS